MADKDVNIRINTAANTQGARDAQRALEDVEDAAKGLVNPLNPMSMPAEMMRPLEERNDVIEEGIELTEEQIELNKELEKQAEQQRSDVEEARRLVAARRADQANEAAEERRGMQQQAAALARGAVYLKAIAEVSEFAGGEIQSLLDQIEEIDPALRSQFVGAEEMAKALQKPFSYVFGTLKDMAGDVMNELAGDPRKAVEGLRQSMELAQQTRSRISAIMQADLRRELGLLDKHQLAVAQFREIAGAEQGADNARSDREAAAAIRGGADVEVVGAAQAQEKLAQAIAAIQQATTDAEGLVRDAERRMTSLRDFLKESASQGDTTSEEVKKAAADLKELEGELVGLRETARTLAATEGAKVAQVTDEIGAELDALRARQQEETTASVRELERNLQELAANASAQGKQYIDGALATIGRALADGVVEASEQKVVVEALARLQQATDSQNAETRKYVSRVEDNMRASITIMENAIRSQEGIKSRLDSIQNLVR